MNNKLLFNFTAIQIISFLITINIMFQFANTRKLSYIIYLLVYLNINRFMLNYGLINSDFGFLLFNIYLLIILYLIYFFQSELKKINYRKEIFSKKIIDIIYGKLVIKHPTLNYMLFFRSCLLFILDDLFNFNNLRKEKVKAVFVVFFSICCIKVLGSYEFLFFTIILLYLIEAEKKKYKSNEIYKLNFDNNVRFISSLESKTLVSNKKINYFFVQKAGMFSAAGKAAAENPKTFVFLGLLAGGGVAADAFTTHDVNQGIRKHNEHLRQMHEDRVQKIDKGNIDVQAAYTKAMTEYPTSGKNGNPPTFPPPNPPTFIPEPKEPKYQEYKQTMIGKGVGKIGSFVSNETKE